jgi:hypothetical protein
LETVREARMKSILQSSVCRVPRVERARWLWKVQATGSRDSSRAYIGKSARTPKDRYIKTSTASFAAEPYLWAYPVYPCAARDRELSWVTFTVATCGTATNARIQSHLDSHLKEQNNQREHDAMVPVNRH